MLLFPLYTTLKNKCVLVVGGGEIAERKIQLMLQVRADIRVVSPTFNETLEALGQHKRIELIRQDFDPVYLDDAWFVIAATNLTDVNARVAHAAHARRLFVNVVDNPILSSVHIPAIVDRSPLMISISSGGSAPMIARHVREQIESLLDDAMGRLTMFADTYRTQIRQQRPDMSARRQFYEWLIRGPVLQYIRDGDEAAAERCLDTVLLQEHVPMPGRTIHVTIASDDPGDITLHTLRALNQADCIFYDDRVHTDILSLARRDADRHSFTGTEQCPDNAIPEAIRQRIAQQAGAGKINVVLTRSSPAQAAPALSEHQTNLNPPHVSDIPEKQVTGSVCCSIDI